MHFLIQQKDSLQVVVANAAALTFSFKTLNEELSTLSILLAISFTVYKFYKEYKK